MIQIILIHMYETLIKYLDSVIRKMSMCVLVRIVFFSSLICKIIFVFTNLFSTTFQIITVFRKILSSSKIKSSADLKKLMQVNLYSIRNNLYLVYLKITLIRISYLSVMLTLLLDIFFLICMYLKIFSA